MAGEYRRTLEEWQELTRLWRCTNFPEASRTPELQFMGVVEEVGELGHVYLKAQQEIRGLALDSAQMLSQERDAIGDILIYLLGYCSARNISIQACLDQAWNEVKKRDWLANPETGESSAQGNGDGRPTGANLKASPSEGHAGVSEAAAPRGRDGNEGAS